MSFEDTQIALNDMIDRSDNIFDVANEIARKSRDIERICHNSVSTSESIRWAITGYPPDDIDKRMYQHAKANCSKTSYMEDVISYIDDDSLIDAVRFSFDKSVDIGRPYFNYGDISDEGKKSRLRVLVQMFWYEMKESGRLRDMTEFDEMFGIDDADGNVDDAPIESNDDAKAADKPKTKRRTRKAKAVKEDTANDGTDTSDEDKAVAKKPTAKRSTAKKTGTKKTKDTVKNVDDSDTAEDVKDDAEEPETVEDPNVEDVEVVEAVDSAADETSTEEPVEELEAVESMESVNDEEPSESDDAGRIPTEEELIEEADADSKSFSESLMEEPKHVSNIILFDAPVKGSPNRIYRNVVMKGVKETDDFIEVVIVKSGYGAKTKYILKEHVGA